MNSEGKSMAEMIAMELVSVQPMDEAGKALTELYKHSKSTQQLIDEGYKPVSQMGLMWVKNNGDQ
jgi:hypothetical protein